MVHQHAVIQQGGREGKKSTPCFESSSFDLVFLLRSGSARSIGILGVFEVEKGRDRKEGRGEGKRMSSNRRRRPTSAFRPTGRSERGGRKVG
jgi:hypothetical protein